MSTMELTLTNEQKELFIRAAATVANGRHAFRMTDAELKDSAKSLVTKNRRESRNVARRERRKYAAIGKRFAFDVGYGAYSSTGETWQERIDEWQTILKSRPTLDRTLSRIARSLLIPRAAKVENWRDIVKSAVADGTLRACQEWRESIAKAGMTIPVSLSDMRADRGSRFFNYAVRRWGNAVQAEFIFGASVEDAFQSAMAECIDSGDWTGPDKRPAYGALWRHIALSVRRAMWTNTRLSYGHGDEPFSWEEWEVTANADIPAMVLRTESGNRQTLAEWVEYQEWRAIRDAWTATRERITAERADRIGILCEARQNVAALILTGLTLRQIAHGMGRTVDGLSRDLADDMSPAEYHLPTRGMTDAERDEKLAFAERMNGHAQNLRTKYADMIADNYANGRVFKRADIPTPTTSGRNPNTFTIPESSGYDARMESLRMRWLAIRNRGMGVMAIA